MAFLLNKATMISHLRSQSQQQNTNDSMLISRRGIHTGPGPREKALLAEDPALMRFKSHKKGVRGIKRIGDILTIVVVAGCCYEIYVRTTTQKEAKA